MYPKAVPLILYFPMFHSIFSEILLHQESLGRTRSGCITGMPLLKYSHSDFFSVIVINCFNNAVDNLAIHL